MFHGAIIEHRHPEKTRAFKDVTKVGKDLEKINNYAKNGGKIVGTYISGVVDENDLAYMNGQKNYKKFTDLSRLKRMFYILGNRI